MHGFRRVAAPAPVGENLGIARDLAVLDSVHELTRTGVEAAAWIRSPLVSPNTSWHQEPPGVRYSLDGAGLRRLVRGLRKSRPEAVC